MFQRFVRAKPFISLLLERAERLRCQTFQGGTGTVHDLFKSDRPMDSTSVIDISNNELIRGPQVKTISLAQKMILQLYRTIFTMGSRPVQLF